MAGSSAGTEGHPGDRPGPGNGGSGSGAGGGGRDQASPCTSCTVARHEQLLPLHAVCRSRGSRCTGRACGLFDRLSDGRSDILFARNLVIRVLLPAVAHPKRRETL